MLTKFLYTFTAVVLAQGMYWGPLPIGITHPGAQTEILSPQACPNYIPEADLAKMLPFAEEYWYNMYTGQARDEYKSGGLEIMPTNGGYDYEMTYLNNTLTNRRDCILILLAEL